MSVFVVFPLVIVVVSLTGMKKPDLFVLTKTQPFLVPKDDLFECLRPLLIFGRVIGLIPISGVFQINLQALQYRKSNAAAIISLLIIILLSSNNCVAAVGFFRSRGKDASELASNAAPVVCYSIALFVYVYMYRNSTKLIGALNEWRNLIVLVGKEDIHLFRDINLIAGLIYTSAILENAVSHVQLFPNPSQAQIVNDSLKTDPLHFYYAHSHPQWAELIPYHPIVAVLVFTCNKLSVYAWNFGDILIASISRALYFKFKALVEEADLKVFHRSMISDSDKWCSLIRDHTNLCNLLEVFNALLSPLIFASYTVNIYFVCLQLHLALAPSGSTNFVKALYSAWSFFHLLGRAYVVSITAARINEYAHLFGKVLQKCPHLSYDTEVDRAERRVALGKMGIGGLNCFVITKPFILSIINVIFTFEIVLLQATAPLPVYPTSLNPASPNCSSCCPKLKR